jgi:hypothetical protein
VKVHSTLPSQGHEKEIGHSGNRDEIEGSQSSGIFGVKWTRLLYKTLRHSHGDEKAAREEEWEQSEARYSYTAMQPPLTMVYGPGLDGDKHHPQERGASVQVELKGSLP